MANEYTTRVLIKNYLGNVTHTSFDTILDDIATAASRRIDDYCGRRFYLDASATPRVYNPAKRLYGDTLLVDDIGSTTGLVVEYGNASDGWTAVDSDDYETEPENALSEGMPITGITNLNGWTLGARTRIRVTARWGLETPPQIEQAALILASRLYKRKDSPEGVLGSAEWGTVRLSKTDPDVADLVARYVRSQV